MRTSLTSAMLVVPWLLLSAPVLAEDAAPEPREAADAREDAGARSPEAPSDVSGERPSLGLDSLLRPRGPAPAPAPRKEPGGRDREAWEQAFADARREIQELKSSIDATRQEVSDRSRGGGYQYSPIGGGGEAPSDPEILKLRAQLRRDKKSLEAAESRLRELQVEASLSGVPDEWMRE